MNARTTRVLLLFQSLEMRSRVMAAVEAAGLTGLLCGGDDELFDSIESLRPKLVCLPFDGQCIEDVARLRLLVDLYPRLSILLFQARNEATAPPQELLESVAGYIEPATSQDQLAREISWRLCVDPAKPQRAPAEVPFFVGRSQVMLQVFDAISRLANSSLPILVQGEHGTGKQLAAIELHRQSARSDLAIHTLECEDFEETELERLLFGPVNHATLPPMLEDPQIGTLVLAELAAISPALQSRLISWLRLNKSHHSRPSIIFTTSRDLGRLVADRKVRADLFLELSNQVIGLPPLRHRPNDLHMLADHFAQHINQYSASLGRPPLQLELKHYQALEHYHWPGNVRELRSVVMSLAFNSGPLEPSGAASLYQEHDQSLSKKLGNLFNLLPSLSTTPAAATISPPNPHVYIDEDHLLKSSRNGVESSTGPEELDNRTSPDRQYWALFVERFAADKSPNIYARALDLFEKELLKQVLDRTGGNLEDSARLLGLTNLNLQKKIEHHEIELPAPFILK